MKWLYSWVFYEWILYDDDCEKKMIVEMSGKHIVYKNKTFWICNKQFT